jgi:UDP-N-acetylmuramoyl-tripeptide--D-alanyl-D-alanine ligase
MADVTSNESTSVRIALSLREIAAITGGRVEGDNSVTVTGPAVLDGRKAEPGGLFVAFAGERADGHDHAAQAGRAGAVAVLGSRPTALPTVVVTDTRAALQALAAHVVARLRGGLTVAALTGSSGKTGT